MAVYKKLEGKSTQLLEKIKGPDRLNEKTARAQAVQNTPFPFIRKIQIGFHYSDLDDLCSMDAKLVGE